MVSEASFSLDCSTDSTPTVFIVDDDTGLCQALVYLLESVDLRCETYASTQQFLDAYDPERPGCLVLDVRMPGMSGLDFQIELAQRRSTLPIIMITGYADVSMAVRAMKAGAIEFLEKPFGDQVILESVQQAIERDRQVRLVERERARFGSRLSTLTQRERQVMDLLVAGKSNKEIADELRVSRKTVETHRAKLMSKTDAKSLAGLIRSLLLYVERT
ncbi:MAG TPA: response regulator transcription factor [Candidatus Binatia bacterium]|nr:response regulator transcription factor [Candidatus Binatia bacterium]